MPPRDVRSAIREMLLLAAVFGVVLGGLFLYTQSWPPAVIVESGSMMHRDSEVTYGRLGTIDPGDLVLVKRVKGIDDVRTQLEGSRDHYGAPGDVIIYRSDGGRSATPIIHRAVAYVEIVGTGEDVRYRVRWSAEAPCEGTSVKEMDERGDWCVFGPGGVYVESVPIAASSSRPNAPVPYRPLRSGFITKGDNPATNGQIDPAVGISRDAAGQPSPVSIEWVEGVARGELPWLGLIKLALAGKANQDSPPDAWVKVGWASAPKDLWVMLAITLAILVGGPLALDGYRAWKRRAEPPAPPSS